MLVLLTVVDITVVASESHHSCVSRKGVEGTQYWVKRAGMSTQPCGAPVFRIWVAEAASSEDPKELEAVQFCWDVGFGAVDLPQGVTHPMMVENDCLPFSCWDHRPCQTEQRSESG